MAGLSFLEAYSSNSNIQLGLNTSPIFDMLTAVMMKGKHKEWITSGGLMPVNGIAGGNNTQKTGKTVKDVASVLHRFPSIRVIFNDTESTFDLTRLAREVDRLYGIDGYFEEHILDKKFIYMPANEGHDGTSIHNLVIEIYKHVEALKNSKDKQDQEEYESLMIKTPIWSNKLNDYIKVICGCLLVNDSISETMFEKLMMNQFEEGEIDAGGKKRTRDMEIGNLRRILMTDASLIGPRVGLRSYWIAQTSDIINMDGRPKEKETVFLRPGKKLAAPKAMMKLPHIGIEIIKGSVLKNNDGKTLYPRSKDSTIEDDARSNPDLIKYLVSIFRNKSGGSGGDISFIASQSEGINEPLSMYDMLKEDKYWGFDGNAVRHQLSIYPEVTLMRTTINEQCREDPKLRRALIITWQMWFQQRFWSIMPTEYIMTPSELYEKIKALGISWDEILTETVDFFHCNPEHIKAHTLTTYELLDVAATGKPLYWKTK